MSESDKIETKPVFGPAHAAWCLGCWDAKAKECGQCLIAEKCADATRRLSGKKIIAAPTAPAPVPASAPAPAAPPKTIVKPASIAAPAAEAPVKPEVKPEAKPEPKQEVKAEPKPAKADDKDFIADAIMPRISGSVTKRDNNGDLFYAFKDESGAVVLQVGYKPQLGKMKMFSKKGTLILDKTFSAEDMKAALDKLL